MRKSFLPVCAVLSTGFVIAFIWRLHLGAPRAEKQPADGQRAALVATPPAKTGKSALASIAKTSASTRDAWNERIRDGLDSLSPGERERVFGDLLPMFTQLDPAAAANFAESNDAGGSHAEVMRNVAESWARADFNAAWAWVVQLRDANERDTLLGCIGFAMAKSDPLRAVHALENGELDASQAIMLGNLAQLWASRDLPGALVWAGNHPAGDLRDDLFLHIALAESATAPADSARIVAEQISPGPNQENAVLAVLDVWAAQDTASASAWVAQFPIGEFRDRATAKISSIAHPEPLLVKLPIGPR